MVVRKIAQGLASQVIEGQFLAGRRQGRRQVQVMADPDIEGAVQGFSGVWPRDWHVVR
ncbi:hypothetical protein O204_14030 [Pseudomonas simiae]|uniref:Uncharacterized protein n=1 Tax=Pseudomonas simiae TaxID=321846 RepID=U1TXD9_9PSED|nr:hypothetical protein O204_14030 [Pseudomonas simiae]